MLPFFPQVIAIQQITTNKEICYQLIDNVAKQSTALIQGLEQVEQNNQAQLQSLKSDLKNYEQYAFTFN